MEYDAKGYYSRGLYHEIFTEPERGRVLADMEAWLEAHTGASPQ